MGAVLWTRVACRPHNFFSARTLPSTTLRASHRFVFVWWSRLELVPFQKMPFELRFHLQRTQGSARSPFLLLALFPRSYAETAPQRPHL